jgi:hypothetical protein
MVFINDDIPRQQHAGATITPQPIKARQLSGRYASSGR